MALQELARRVGNPAPLCPCRRRVYLSALLSCQMEDTGWETVVGELSAGAWGSQVSRGCADTVHVSKVRAGVLPVPPLRGAECPSVAVGTLAPGSVDDTGAGRVVTRLFSAVLGLGFGAAKLLALALLRDSVLLLCL